METQTTQTTKTAQTYVIWTETGKEEHLVEFLGNTVLQRDTVADTKIYVPKKKKLLRGPKGWAEVEDILFPSYVFLDTADIMAVYDQLTSAPSIKTFYRMLGTETDEIRTVTAAEKLWIDHILGDERIAGVSKGIKEGKTITFIQGPLVGLEAFVKFVNRHHRYAELEMEFFGGKRRIQLPVDVMNKMAVEKEEHPAGD